MNHKPGYVASLLDCQRKLVETLNTAMNRLGELDDPQAASAAREGRDTALALLPNVSMTERDATVSDLGSK